MIIVHTPALYETGGGFKDHAVPRNAVVMGKPADAPGAVAAHLAQRAVGVVKNHFEVGLVGVSNGNQTIGMAHGTQLLGQGGEILLLPATGIQHHKAVARAVHIGNVHFRASVSSASIS